MRGFIRKKMCPYVVEMGFLARKSSIKNSMSTNFGELVKWKVNWKSGEASQATPTKEFYFPYPSWAYTPKGIITTPEMGVHAIRLEKVIFLFWQMRSAKAFPLSFSFSYQNSERNPSCRKVDEVAFLLLAHEKSWGTLTYGGSYSQGWKGDIFSSCTWQVCSTLVCSLMSNKKQAGRQARKCWWRRRPWSLLLQLTMLSKNPVWRNI